jgi:two-component system cell cycle response regulator
MTGRILIVDDVATNRIVLRGRLSAALHDTILAEDGAQALRLTDEMSPDLVLLDLHLPDMPGTEVLARLRADPRHRDLPVIMHTAQPTPTNRLAALRAGADDIMPKPVDGPLLLARIRALLRRRDPGHRLDLPYDGFGDEAEPYDWPGSIAVLSPRRAIAAALRTRLSPLMPHGLTLGDRAALIGPQPEVAPPRLPDAYLIDATEDPQGAAALLSELRSTLHSRDAGIAVLLSDPSAAPLAYDLGADEALLADAPPDETALRLTAMLRRTRAAASRRASLHDQARLAMTDPLTGLHNRRYALRRMGEMTTAAIANGRGFVLLLADLDHFKQVNDRFGHVAGDDVLAEVASRLRAGMAPDDLLARIGGEEFLIALPGSSCAEGSDRARRLCESIAGTPIRLKDGRSVTVTMSVGIATSGPGLLPDQVIDAADRALRAAKTQGRNRVIVSRSAA